MIAGVGSVGNAFDVGSVGNCFGVGSVGNLVTYRVIVGSVGNFVVYGVSVGNDYGVGSVGNFDAHGVSVGCVGNGYGVGSVGKFVAYVVNVGSVDIDFRVGNFIGVGDAGNRVGGVGNGVDNRVAKNINNVVCQGVGSVDDALGKGISVMVLLALGMTWMMLVVMYHCWQPYRCW